MSGEFYLVVVCGSRSQATYWEECLKPSQSPYSSGKTHLGVVVERWRDERGAGNALGTFNAFLEAADLFRLREGVDLVQKIREGARCAIYHTAGRGTRLYPLTASEGGDKSRILMPYLAGHASGRSMTLLESVIYQTRSLCKNACVGVFWGDQLFIPPTPMLDNSPVHICLCEQPIPSSETWRNEGLSNYGILTPGEGGKLKMLDKLSIERFESLRNSGVLRGSLGLNLGSFIFSIDLLMSFLDLFHAELTSLIGHLNSDPDLWMPLTLERELYCSLKPKSDLNHYCRMQKWKESWEQMRGEAFRIAPIAIENRSMWWDFGTVKLFHENALRSLKETQEANLLRKLFHLNARRVNNAPGKSVEVDQESLIVGSRVQSGRIKRSILIGVDAESIDVEDAVVIETKCRRLVVPRGLVYRVFDENAVVLERDGVRAGCTIRGERSTAMSALDADSKAIWNEKLPGSDHSFAELERAVREEFTDQPAPALL
ncbi:MAG: hypothetical protein KDK40_02630 [Chlamydiia bacterium]|nr:hypothetical protein [Chlamydiia bacterium]